MLKKHISGMQNTDKINNIKIIINIIFMLFDLVYLGLTFSQNKSRFEIKQRIIMRKECLCNKRYKLN